MPTKCSWAIHGSLTSERKASTSPSSFINHSILLSAQAPSSVLVFTLTCTSKFEHSERVDALDLRAVEVIICMITRDFSVISMTSQASLSLSLSLSQKSLTHNIGSASALPIILNLVLSEARSTSIRTVFPLPWSHAYWTEASLPTVTVQSLSLPRSWTSLRKDIDQHCHCSPGKVMKTRERKYDGMSYLRHERSFFSPFLSPFLRKLPGYKELHLDVRLNWFHVVMGCFPPFFFFGHLFMLKWKG